MAESMGLVGARKNYSGDNLECFVLYKLAGRSSTEIVYRYAGAGKALDKSTVLKGIKAAGKLIGWEHQSQPRQTQNRKVR
jgi:hypothetical protein